MIIMFDNLKNRFRKKDYTDFGDIKSDVLGSSFTPERDFPPQPRKDFQSGFDDVVPRGRGRQPSVGIDEQDFPPGFSNIDTRAPQQAPTRDYDLMDRLSIIESQLSAIRSQTETINERLKNLEAKLTRRY